ncbi:DNA-binding transcriptional regulator SoxS [compost metagenome]
MERAAQLLAGTQRQVSEIAADVGFDCAIHFTRKFRDTYDETPSVYRKRKREELLKAEL